MRTEVRGGGFGRDEHEVTPFSFWYHMKTNGDCLSNDIYKVKCYLIYIRYISLLVAKRVVLSLFHVPSDEWCASKVERVEIENRYD